jgi:hypothetical protein
VSGGEAQLRLQHYWKKKGITDIEILLSNRLHLIAEAKCGWHLPKYSQLKKYASRLRRSQTRQKKILVLSECSKTYAENYLDALEVKGIPIEPISWKSVDGMISRAFRSGSHAEKRLLRDLQTYLGKVTKMQDIDSNKVFVVSLGHGTHSGWKISWVDVVRERRRYFHPMGIKGWPKEPPNYIAFRYRGKLMSIHHIKGYEVGTDLHKYLREIPKKKRKPFFIYKLGPAIKPSREIPNGAVYPNGRIWCMFDTLFTSNTIAQARDITKKRLKLAKKNG